VRPGVCIRMPSFKRSTPTRGPLAGALICLILAPASATALTLQRPLQFFSGRTETLSTVKVVAKKPYRSRTTGSGRILPDGSLLLVQQVFDEGQTPQQRSWRIRQLGPGRYGGTMTDAIGPVMVQDVGGRYRFTFRMKGNLSVEQWLTPLAGGRVARSDVTVKKFGFRVASSAGMVRKI